MRAARLSIFILLALIRSYESPPLRQIGPMRLFDASRRFAGYPARRLFYLLSRRRGLRDGGARAAVD